MRSATKRRLIAGAGLTAAALFGSLPYHGSSQAQGLPIRHHVCRTGRRNRRDAPQRPGGYIAGGDSRGLHQPSRYFASWRSAV